MQKLFPIKSNNPEKFIAVPALNLKDTINKYNGNITDREKSSKQNSKHGSKQGSLPNSKRNDKKDKSEIMEAKISTITKKLGNIKGLLMDMERYMEAHIIEKQQIEDKLNKLF